MSIFNPTSNVLFIHVPKTAGTSMEYRLFIGGGGHLTIRDFNDVGDAFKFSFVRNPWDRFVSAYFCQNHVEKSKAGFNQFVQGAVLAPEQYPNVGINRTHFLPQWHFLLDNDDEIGVDFIGKYESLQEDWSYVCNRVGVTDELCHERKVDHAYYEYYYTPDSWEAIGKMYERDIDLFRYNDA